MNNSNQTLEKNDSNTEESLTAITILVQKRNGTVAEFDSNRIRTAIEKAFKAERKVSDTEELDPFSAREVKAIGDEVIKRAIAKLPPTKEINIEQIQD